MKLKLISTLIAATFLAGCSSNGSSNDGDTGPAPQDGIADITTYEGDIFNAALIQGDEGEHNAFVAVDNEGSGYVHLNGETYFVENGDVTDKNGEAVGSIEGQDNGYIFHGNNGGEITLTNVDGRLVVSGYQPPLPGNDLPNVDPDFGVIPTDVWYIDSETGVLTFNGEPLGTITPTDDVKDGTGTYTITIGDTDEVKHIQVVNYGGYVEIKVPGKGRLAVTIDNGVITRIGWDTPEMDNPIETDPGFGNDRVIKDIERFERADGTVIVRISGFNGGDIEFTTDQHGKVVGIHANEQAKAYFKDKIGNDVDRQALKSKIQSLSQEQRQQIKQAVKDRVSRS
ncbi:hypothetical protein [Vibrio methylphosphonaticus]|uniref:hypothetical protein n=1 Tax=Vibrio methylphosphonaticus TaxID=2946866 RepID=UPI00202A5CD3|nr:hypothetical protein [Vibrio methylphosphonaticus]MCL9774094.1 hypothetical protein [Vibrio methylphosphonaticus]